MDPLVYIQELVKLLGSHNGFVTLFFPVHIPSTCTSTYYPCFRPIYSIYIFICEMDASAFFHIYIYSAVFLYSVLMGWLGRVRGVWGDKGQGSAATEVSARRVVASALASRVQWVFCTCVVRVPCGGAGFCFFCVSWLRRCSACDLR